MTKSKVSREPLETTGQNLIRIVIASYFMAVALGLISGTHAGPLLAPVLGPVIGNEVGGLLTCAIAFTLLCGAFMRATALALASIVLAASALTTFGPNGHGALDVFWRDLALISALLLTYLGRDRRSRRRAGILRRKPVVRRMQVSERIVPRRVRPETDSPAPVRRARLAQTEDGAAFAPRPMREAEPAAARLSRSQIRRLRAGIRDMTDTPEIDNIFAETPEERAA